MGASIGAGVGSGGLRERSKLRRRRLILHTALRLFAEHGYDRTTIADIAEAAEVAPRTVSGYFPSKLDFVVEWPLGRSARMIELFQEHPGIGFVSLVDLWWRDLRETVDREEAALTRAMALANPGVVAMAEVEAAERTTATGLSLPTLSGPDRADLRRQAGRAAVHGINQVFLRGIAEDRMTDATHDELLGLIRTVVDATGIGHGSLQLDR